MSKASQKEITFQNLLETFAKDSKLVRVHGGSYNFLYEYSNNMMIRLSKEPKNEMKETDDERAPFVVWQEASKQKLAPKIAWCGYVSVDDSSLLLQDRQELSKHEQSFSRQPKGAVHSCIVLEAHGQNAFEFLKTELEEGNWDVISSVIKQISDLVFRLVQLHFACLDIKLLNIVVRKDPLDVRLIDLDYGLCRPTQKSKYSLRWSEPVAWAISMILLAHHCMRVFKVNLVLPVLLSKGTTKVPLSSPMMRMWQMVEGAERSMHYFNISNFSELYWLAHLPYNPAGLPGYKSPGEVRSKYKVIIGDARSAFRSIQIEKIKLKNAALGVT